MKIENNNKSSTRPVEDAIIQNEEQSTFEKRYWKLLNKLTPKEYIVLALCLGGLNNGQNLAEDAEVTRQNISRLKVNIAKKLKKIS